MTYTGSAVLKIEEGHREDGGQVGAREEDRAEKGNGFHGCAVAFRGMCELALLTSHLEVEFGLFLGDDVV